MTGHKNGAAAVMTFIGYKQTDILLWFHVGKIDRVTQGTLNSIQGYPKGKINSLSKLKNQLPRKSRF